MGKRPRYRLISQPGKSPNKLEKSGGTLYAVKYPVLPYMLSVLPHQLFTQLERDLEVRIVAPKNFQGDLHLQGSADGISSAMRIISPAANAAKERWRLGE